MRNPLPFAKRCGGGAAGGGRFFTSTRRMSIRGRNGQLTQSHKGPVLRVAVISLIAGQSMVYGHATGRSGRTTLPGSVKPCRRHAIPCSRDSPHRGQPNERRTKNEERRTKNRERSTKHRASGARHSPAPSIAVAASWRRLRKRRKPSPVRANPSNPKVPGSGTAVRVMKFPPSA